MRRQQYPLFVSQDGTPPNALAARGVHYLHHMELAAPVPKSPKESLAYYRIANHYKFIMQTFFDCFRFPRLIILEVCNPACGHKMPSTPARVPLEGKKR